MPRSGHTGSTATDPIQAMTLLLTGASGFVGRHVQAAMDCVPLEEGDELVELRDYGALRDAVRRVKPDRVLHLAAQSNPPRSFEDPEETFAINFTGTHNLLQALREIGFKGRLLFVGSGDMYGLVPQNELPVTENRPLKPRNPYAVSKVAAEALCFQWSLNSGFEIVLVRPFNHVGPGQSPDYALPGFAAQLAEIRAGRREAVLETGNLSVTRDFCDVRDVVRAYALLLDQGRNGEVYNICSGLERNLEEIVADLIRLADVPVRMEQRADKMRPVEQPRMVGSHEKLTGETGWNPEIPWERTLQDLFDDWMDRIP